MKDKQKSIEAARDEILELYNQLQKIAGGNGISVNDLLTKMYLTSSKNDKKKIDTLGKQIAKIGAVRISTKREETIPIQYFIEQSVDLEEEGLSKKEIAERLGMNPRLFEKKYNWFGTEIAELKKEKNLKEQLTPEDIEFLKELKEIIKNAKANKTRITKYPNALNDEKLMISAYLKLKTFFLEERNEGLLPNVTGYITKEDFFNILRGNHKILSNSFENKIKPLTDLIDEYYAKSQTNNVVMGFNRIYGTSYEKLHCTLEIARDEKCLGDIAKAPKNFMCSPVKIYTAIQKWKPKCNRELATIITRMQSEEILELPKRYQDILDSKKMRSSKKEQVGLEL